MIFEAESVHEFIISLKKLITTTFPEFYRGRLLFFIEINRIAKKDVID